MSEGRLEPEVQIASNGSAQEQQRVEPVQDEMLESVTGDSRLSPEIQSLIERCMSGDEPLGRSLKAWEVLKFNPNHVNMCVLRASGFRNQEISQILNESPAHISQILCHPYGLKLVRALSIRSSVKVFDIRTKLEDYASDLLDQTFAQALLSEDLDTVSKVTFSMLDRAGYSPAQGAGDPKTGAGFSASESTMKRLARAMEQSQQVKSEVMPGWIPRRPPEEGALPALPAGGVVGAEDDAREENSQQVAAGGRK